MKKTLLLLVAVTSICFAIAGVHGFQTGRLTTVITAHGNERELSINLPDVGQFYFPQGDQVIIGRAEAVTEDASKIKTIAAFDPSVQSEPVKGAVETSTTVEEFDNPGNFTRIFKICESAWDLSRFIWSQVGTDADIEFFNDYKGGSELILREEIRGGASFLRDQNGAVSGTWYNDRTASTGRGVLPGMYFAFPNQGPDGYIRSPLFTTAYNMAIMNSEIGKAGSLRVVVKVRSGKVALAVTDIVVKRMGGPLNKGIGVFTGQIRTVESGFPFSPDECPAGCPQQPTPTPAVCIPTPTPTTTPTPTPTPAPTPAPPPPGMKCVPLKYYTPLELLQQGRRDKWTGQVMLVGGQIKNINEISSMVEQWFRNVQFSPDARFNREFVALQLAVNFDGGWNDPRVVDARWSMLGCAGWTFTPITLSNGFVIEPSTKLEMLRLEIEDVARSRRTQDYEAVTNFLAVLNQR